ncbi:MAG TPA: GNAT family N-acetyltransferase [Actinokineospora sp.]|nr:GNAT family N-acetyltransferase [Actinokineospora sp.]
MHELTTPADVAAATADPLLHWGAQALAPGYLYPGGGAWTLDGATAVHAPGLYRRDRILLTGPPEPALKLLTTLIADLPGPPVPVAATALADRMRELDPRVVDFATFGWMTTSTVPTERRSGPRWLADADLAQADALVRASNPDSWVMPGEPGTRRWAGLFDGDTLISVAGDCWQAPAVGFIAGVATHPNHRGRGASSAVCAFLRDELVTELGACALMVYQDNDVAIRLYERLGFTYQSMSAIGLD